MFNDSIKVFTFKISEMIEACTFGVCCVNFACQKEHPKDWSPSSGAFTRAKIAEKNAKKGSIQLKEVKKTGDNEAIEKLKNSVLENSRKVDYYSELSQLVKYEYYSWFWKEAERIEAEKV